MNPKQYQSLLKMFSLNASVQSSVQLFIDFIWKMAQKIWYQTFFVNFWSMGIFMANFLYHGNTSDIYFKARLKKQKLACKIKLKTIIEI